MTGSSVIRRVSQRRVRSAGTQRLLHGCRERMKAVTIAEVEETVSLVTPQPAEHIETPEPEPPAATLRKPRPSSAPARRPRSRQNSAVRARPNSGHRPHPSSGHRPSPSSGHRPRPDTSNSTPDPEESARQLHASFTRSLRLLGLHHDIALQGPRPRAPRPPNLQHGVLAVAADRRSLASAVYQEWYFGKLEQERARRLREASERIAREQLDMQRKDELRAKAEENYAAWLHRKEEKHADLVKREREKRQRETRKLREDAERIQQSLARWTENKEKQLKREAKEKREKGIKEMEKKRVEEEEKRKHAQEAYAAWQKKAREIALAQAAQEKRELEKAERKRRSAEQQRLEAISCFVTWRECKEKQLRARMRALRISENRVAEDRRKRLAERLYEAEQAYSEWLDALEEREQRIASS